jgi:hypothetical protein
MLSEACEPSVYEAHALLSHLMQPLAASFEARQPCDPEEASADIYESLLRSDARDSLR